VQVVASALRMAVCDRCESGLETGEGLNAFDLACFDQRSDAAPGDATRIVTGEKGVFRGS
tara:strand:+ start:684 stop:863 length:180 start_codon:yes stop_codon:yes gene_type:complete